MNSQVWRVNGANCQHCVDAISAEVSGVPGVRQIEVDLKTKRVTVHGSGIDSNAIRAAIDEAGYDATPL